jgi:hypothetical protein
MTNRHSAAAGDELLPAANMILDHRATINAQAEQIWPWLIQLGKRRAGWYLPTRLERLVPERRHALRVIDPRLQNLTIGDRIPDYGGRDDWLEVARVEPPHTLVYRTERRGRPFTWALLLQSTQPGQSELRLRFRGHVRSRGLQRHAIVTAGGFFDWLTGAVMIQGLQERVDQAHASKSRPGTNI